MLTKNSHIHDEIGRDVVQRLLACPYLSDYDGIACTAVYGYKSEEEYALAISSLAMDDIPVPFLALQPRDDPLHQVR
jgi:predicted alpha/beta-fold hydrolase